MNNDITFPRINIALIKILDTLYPDRCPGPNESLDSIRVKSGQRSVVNRLIQEFEKQNQP